MAALDFPASPSLNDIFSSGGRSWQWDGTSWNSVTPTSLTNVTGTLAVANGGTGASDTTNARANLGLAIGTDVQAYDAGLTSIAGLTTSADQGIYATAADTYATFSLTSAGRALLDDADAAAQRTTLGLGSIATQDASSVSITGGSITGITDLAVADGGTGASTAADARVNLLPSYTGNGSKVLSLNSGATDVEWATPSGGGGTTYVVKTANYTMADLEGVLANTSAGSFTVTLPATPTVGSQCIIADDADTFGTNNLTVGRNGSTIEGTAADLVLDISGVSVQFVYSGSTWNVYAQIGGNGGTATVVTLDAVQTITNKTFTTGNAFNGTLGATTPSTGAFTTLSSTGAMKSGTTGTNGHLQLARSSDGATITNFITDGTNGIINSVIDTIFQANTTERMRITSAGNVGIGTASPSGKLQVVANTASAGLEDGFSVSNAVDSNCFLQCSGSAATDKRSVIGPSTGTALAFQTGASERMRITDAGNVGIGTTTPSFKFEVQQGSSGASPSLRQTPQVVLKGYGGSSTYHSGIGFSMYEHTNGYWGSGILEVDDSGSYGAAMAFYTSTGSATPTPSERMRIDSSGKVLIGTTTAPTISGVPSGSSVVRAGAGNWTWSVQSTSAGTNRGLVVNYSASSPNDTTSEMIFCYDSTGTQRFGVRSNGGIANYQANDANLSDERVKKDITPSDSYLAKMCAIEVVKFKYKDQTHDDFNLGVIAQQVEAVAPEFVDADGFSPLSNDEIPLKAIYQTDLSYGILKAVQELAEENKALRARVAALESN